MKITINNTLEEISKVVAEIDDYLKSKSVNSHDRVRAILVLEETLVKIHDVQEPGGTVTIRTTRTLKRRSIKLSYRGRQLSLNDEKDIDDVNFENLSEHYDPEEENYIRDLILRTNAKHMGVSRKGDVNIISILVSENSKVMLVYTLCALILGILVGFVCRNMLSPDLLEVCNNKIFYHLYSVFLSAVQMVIAPLVFFSLAASISGMRDIGSLGRMGIKVFGCYIITTLCAILLSFGVDYVYQPGDAVIANLPRGRVATEVIELSLFQTIINIIPSNLFASFVKADMLQIMFLAILTGIAAGRMGKYSEQTQKAIEALNDLFSSITSIISNFLPFAVFGSMAYTVSTLDARMFATVFNWIIEMVICSILMYSVYLAFILVFGRINPIKFMQKSYIVSLTGFMTSSSSATMPTSMECCKRMGISPRLYSFSIPLGVTVNMDGLCIMFTTSTLFLASLYGHAMEGSVLLEFITTMVLLSVALPGVPGAATASMLMLFAIAGVPAEAFSLIIGFCPIVELFGTMLNVTGDCAITTLVSRSENLLDMEKYNS